jgi:excisionase family DNA binding protein
MNGNERYLTVGEAASYLNTSERFVRRLISERRVAFHHVGRHVRLAVSDLEAFVLAGRVEPVTRRGVRRSLSGAA